MSAISIPKMFYGTHASVNKQWSRYIKTAWQNGDWGTLLQDAEMTALSPDQDLWVSDPRRIVSGKENLWRIYVLGHELRNKACSNTSQEMKMNSIITYDKLVLSGMDYFWFMLGLTYNCYGFFFLEESLRNAISTEIYAQYFSKMACWIPELLKHEEMYRGSLAIDRSLKGITYSWHVAYSAMLHALGWKIKDAEKMLYDKSLLIDFMKENSIIEIEGDTCRANKIFPR